MDINLMVWAAPFYLIFITLEFGLSWYKEWDLYSFNDSINNFCTGILEETASLPFKGIVLFCYHYLYTYYALYHFDSHIFLSWFILWLGVDFCYYWYHRASHRNSFFWIGHSVHHQSERYNLSVALRQGFFQTMTSWVFYLPLALVGFSPSMFLTMVFANTAYQFWLHTPFIKTMGWFEICFNSPSHHRVHHGKNSHYIDKNYGGSLIVWDKCFGTFEAEGEPPLYGVTEPLTSWNPFQANIKVIKDIWYYGKKLHPKTTTKTKTIVKVKVLAAFFMPPEWIIKQLNKETEKREKKDRKITTCTKENKHKIYSLFNLALLLILYSWCSLIYTSNSTIALLAGVLVLITLYGLGHIADGKTYKKSVEIKRTLIVMAISFLLTHHWLVVIIAGTVFYSINYMLLHLSSFKNKKMLAAPSKAADIQENHMHNHSMAIQQKKPTNQTIERHIA